MKVVANIYGKLTMFSCLSRGFTCANLSSQHDTLLNQFSNSLVSTNQDPHAVEVEQYDLLVSSRPVFTSGQSGFSPLSLRCDTAH